MNITAKTQIAGVVGAPVRHSLSPIIHNAWIEAAGLDAVYLAFEPPAQRFEAFVEGLRGRSLLGLNVTTPFKDRAFAIADDVEPAAASISAANLLLFDAEGRIEARSTDGDGLIGALEAAGAAYGSGPVVVLGAGGAARSIVHAVRHHGGGEIRIVNRTRERAERLVLGDPGRTVAYAWADMNRALTDARVVINATSLGMAGQPVLDVDLRAAPPTALVADIVYHPLATGFLQRARERGHATVDGLDMLIGQARPSFAALFDRPAPELDVRTLCEAALAERS